jgi:hypothetical protein
MILGDPMDWTWTNDPVAPPVVLQRGTRYRGGHRVDWIIRAVWAAVAAGLAEGAWWLR